MKFIFVFSVKLIVVQLIISTNSIRFDYNDECEILCRYFFWNIKPESVTSDVRIQNRYHLTS